MDIQSTRFGPLTIDENKIITFPNGFAAMPDFKRFVMLHDIESQQPIVCWLQSLDNPDITFNVIDPTELGLHYELKLTDEETAQLEIQNTENLGVFLLVGRNIDDLNKIEPKTHLPLVINLASQRGIQKMGVKADIVFRSV